MLLAMPCLISVSDWRLMNREIGVAIDIGKCSTVA